MLSFPSSQALLILGLILPYLLCWLFVRTYAVDTPLSDDFTLVLALQLKQLGKFSLVDLLNAQHNEHRIALPYALMIGLAQLTHYNTIANMYAGLVFMGATLAILCLWLSKQLTRRAISPFWLIPVALVICSLRQTQNLLMSFQGAFESIFFFVLAVYLLDGVSRFVPRFCLALAAALLSAFSFANGLLSLPIGMFYLISKSFLVDAERGRFLRLALIWLVASLSISWLYFHGFNSSVGQGKVSLAFAREHGDQLARFALYFMAGSFARDQNQAALIGLSFIALAVLAVFGFVRSSRSSQSILLLPLMLVIYALLSALMAACGRAEMGLAAALVSRYATVANYGWVGLYVLLLFLSHEKSANREADKSRQVLRAAFAILLCCFAWGTVNTLACAGDEGISFRAVELETANVIGSYRQQGPLALTNATGVNADMVIPLIEFMAANKLSLFHKPPLSEWKRVENRLTNPYWVSIDRVNNALLPNNQNIPDISTVTGDLPNEISISGWAADVDHRSLPAAIWLTVDNQPLVPAACGLWRPDIRLGLHQDYLIGSGFKASFRLDLLGRGQHNLAVRILSGDKRSVYQSAVLLHLKTN
jgi:hypothetical protein